ncbi:MAG: lysophospholipid acyltransferase family protein [Acidimicrobiales bacterium]|nr:lysophospholipid acyltransferase family protein [Acidimicrobiales bacterium]
MSDTLASGHGVVAAASNSSGPNVLLNVHTPSPAIRRLLAAGLVLGTPMLLLLAPALFAVALVIDLATAPRRRRLLRLLAFVYGYVLLEGAGIMLAVLLWIATGCGLFMSTRWSRRAHYRVQRWWAHSIVRAAQRFLRLQIEIDGLALVTETPAIVAAQHASFFDALLPTIVLAHRTDRAARHVLKRELAWDPCLGLYGNRHPNHFVARASERLEGETTAIERLAATAGPEALVLFPEGTFYSEARAKKSMARLAEQDPQRHDRLDLRHLLPPRPGGILAMLRGRPRSDVLFIAHTGFEPFGSLRSIAAHVPFVEPIRVKLWRIAAADMPREPEERMAVIDQTWQAMDDWVAASARPARPSRS